MARIYAVLYVNKDIKGTLTVEGKIYPTAEQALYAFAETPCVWSEPTYVDSLEEVKKAVKELQELCNTPDKFYEKYGDFM